MNQHRHIRYILRVSTFHTLKPKVIFRLHTVTNQTLSEFSFISFSSFYHFEYFLSPSPQSLSTRKYDRFFVYIYTPSLKFQAQIYDLIYLVTLKQLRKISKLFRKENSNQIRETNRKMLSQIHYLFAFNMCVKSECLALYAKFLLLCYDFFNYFT